jgi:hypothetical protein
MRAHTIRIVSGAAGAVLAVAALAAPAAAADTSFAVTTVLRQANAGTCPPEVLGQFRVGQSASDTGRLSVDGATATQTTSSGLVLTGPVSGSEVSVSLTRQLDGGALGQITEQRETTVTVSGTSATGSSTLTLTLADGRTCSFVYDTSATLGTALLAPAATPSTTVAVTPVDEELAATGTAVPALLVTAGVAGLLGGVALWLARRPAPR